MMTAAEKKRLSLQKRRKIAIVAVAVFIVLLAIALVFVLDYVNTHTFEDKADGTVYYIRHKNGEYGLYDTDRKTLLPKDSEYGYYETHAHTLVSLDPETGEVLKTIYVDNGLVGSEVLDVQDQILMFPKLEREQVRSLEVHGYNGESSFTFARYNANTLKADDNGNFAIVGSILTEYDQEKFSALYVAASYTISSQKIKEPIKDANGAFSEYGLVPERRVDDEGNEYDYVPAYYILTEKTGKQHKVIIGDALVTGGGYYAQYVELNGSVETPRDAVYVMGTHLSSSLLAPIKDFVTPRLTYPLSMNSYFDVENFQIFERVGDTLDYKQMIGFSYVDIGERENTINANVAYRFEEGDSPASTLEGFIPAATNIVSCLDEIYDPRFVGIHRFMVSDADMVEAGFWKPVTDGDGNPKLDANGKPEYDIVADYMITFYYNPLDDDGNELDTILQTIMISGPNENGNYYAYSTVSSKVTMDDGTVEYLPTLDYDMIVEIEAYGMRFLEWDAYDWVESNYFNLNIAFCESIKIESGSYWADFKLDNSLSDQSAGIASNRLSVSATDSLGNQANTFALLTVNAKYQKTWVISETAIKVYDTVTGTEQEYTSIHYEFNCVGSQVQVDTVGIECLNGDKIYVEADTIIIAKADGTEERIVRYQTQIFRHFYQTLAYSSIVDSYPLDSWTDAEREALLSDSNMILKMTVKNTEGKTTVYRFYSIPGSSRKAFMTIDGNGEFYVTASRLDKIVNDAQRFFRLEPIDGTDKT